ncbi:MAG: hypothetical protein G01um101418_194 [Parcubacteria group bacterium Gr01-1014_18]|nr:MAG: hypothetical protein Greene041636_162 [Parcubacteria group bacterium Greene0416_36]TSC81354.1 MAG: hypothetical protein G01um101418_194 [Parcubacteria group bacterium Gr01-1014_18]TSC99460.1 MAG: hypothetical protein Greene101420_127 [Parcubacteria group bacterium Greene1014_20]TSD07621.1 MAG: hypothetical protein Greene07142_78 [Parcubacteria group bacterium Greene0714_2]
MHPSAKYLFVFFCLLALSVAGGYAIWNLDHRLGQERMEKEKIRSELKQATDFLDNLYPSAPSNTISGIIRSMDASNRTMVLETAQIVLHPLRIPAPIERIITWSLSTAVAFKNNPILPALDNPPTINSLTTGINIEISSTDDLTYETEINATEINFFDNRPLPKFAPEVVE